MKKKTIILILTGIMILGTGVFAGASINDYLRDMQAWEEGSLKHQVKERFEERSNEVDTMLYRDTRVMMFTHYEQITEEMFDYMDEELKNYELYKLNLNAEEINQEAERIKDRTREYIRELMSERFEYYDPEATTPKG